MKSRGLPVYWFTFEPNCALQCMNDHFSFFIRLGRHEADGLFLSLWFVNGVQQSSGETANGQTPVLTACLDALFLVHDQLAIITEPETIVPQQERRPMNIPPGRGEVRPEAVRA